MDAWQYPNALTPCPSPPTGEGSSVRRPKPRIDTDQTRIVSVFHPRSIRGYKLIFV